MKSRRRRSKLIVLKATYGVPGDPARSRDVRERLQQRIDAGERQLPVSRLAEGDDPAYGVVKTLEVECKVGDKLVTAKGNDTQIILLSGDTSALEQGMILNSPAENISRPAR